MLYKIAQFIERLILKFFYQIKVTGLEYIPFKGRAILVVNHASFLDSLFLTAFIPRKMYFLVYKKLYHKWYLNWIFRAMSCIPTNGCTGKAMQYLKEGKLLGIFPEGKRSNDGNLKRGKTGTALFAIKTKSPVIPVGISGTWEAYPPGKKLPKLFRSISVKIGQQLYFNHENQNEVSNGILHETTEIIMKAIEERIAK